MLAAMTLKAGQHACKHEVKDLGESGLCAADTVFPVINGDLMGFPRLLHLGHTFAPSIELFKT